MKTIGIDLGTTNTVAASSGQVFELDGQTGALLPSVVAFPPNGARVVGSAASRRRPIDPHNTLFSTKRLIGRKWFSQDILEFKNRYDFDLVEGEDATPEFKTRSGLFSPTDIAASLLQRVCQYSSADFDEAAAVITVPSMFGQAERKATHEAATLAGMASVDIIDEPTAVALAYRSARGKEFGRAAVYDFGGGTFDLAVVDGRRGMLRVLASGGDLYLGGDDIDQGLAKWAAEKVAEEHHWDLRTESQTYARLVAECEQAKIRLSNSSETHIDLTRVDPVSPVASATLTIDSKLVASLTAALVQRTFVICDEVLRAAGVQSKDLDALFVAGGALQLPSMKEAVEQYFDKEIEFPFHPMQVVAIGASLAGD